MVIRNTFATTVRSLILVAFFVAVAQNSALAKKGLDFTLVNYSGKTFQRLYVYASGACGVTCNGSFDGEVLGNKTLKHGYSMKITFSDEAVSHKYWDIKVEFKDGENDNFWIWYGINLTECSKITIDAHGTAHFS